MDQHTLQTGDPLFVAEVTVAAGETVSGILETNGYVPVALRTPATLTSTAVTFKAGSRDGDMLEIRGTEGSAVSVTVAAARHIPVTPSNFAGVHRLQLVTGSIEAAARVFGVVLRKLGAS